MAPLPTGAASPPTAPVAPGSASSMSSASLPPATASSPTAPRTAVAAIDVGVGAVIDAIVGLDALVSTLMAARSVAIDELHSLVLSAEVAAAAARPQTSASSSASLDRSWTTEQTARRVVATELSAALHVSEREAEQLLADSTDLVRRFPTALGALRAGRLTFRHASILVDEARTLPAETWPEFEAAAVVEAESRTPGGFRQKARAMREAAHPASIDERGRLAAESRSVRLEPGRDGMAWLSAHLPAEQAIAAHDRLTQMAATLADPTDERTHAQRATDLFADLLIDGVLPESGIGRGIRARVLVTVPALTLLDRADDRSAPPQLEGYGPISPSVARRLAAHAPSFVRLLTHPETGTVLSVGRDRYAVPRDLRLWLRLRDGTCRFPGCGRAAASADIDHTIDWQHHGATRHDNLAHLCRSHHRLKHRTDWRVRHAGGGALEWTSPSGHRYRTEPAARLTG